MVCEAPKRIVVVNGPNLNLLGKREPAIYGSTTLADIEELLQSHIREKSLVERLCLTFTQSNHEGVLIDTIHEARENSVGLIINPGGLTHTSVALRDALAAYEPMAVEVHLSNIHTRESFRQHSYISGVVQGTICGLGALGYRLALEAVINSINWD